MSGRIRSVKPEWLEDELLAGASDEARVLSVGLILAADDYGNGRATIATIAADVWRYQMGRDDGAHAHEVVARASRAFRELLAMRFVGEWSERGQRYFAIRNWKKHQKVDKPGKPLVPAPPADLFNENTAESEHSRESRESVASPSREPREALAPDLRPTTNDQDQRGEGISHARDGLGGPLAADTVDTPLARLRRAFEKRWLAKRTPNGMGLGTHWPGFHKHSDLAKQIAERFATDPTRMERSLDGYFATSTPFEASVKWNFKTWANDPDRYIATRSEPTSNALEILSRVPRITDKRTGTE